MKVNAMAFPASIRDFNAKLHKTLKITWESLCTKFRGLAETWLIQRKLPDELTAMGNCHPCLPLNGRKKMLGGGVQQRHLRNVSNCQCTPRGQGLMTFAVSV